MKKCAYNGQQVRRYSDRRLLSADTGIDWAGFISGTVAPRVDMNVVLDDSTTKTIYVATGVLSAALIIAAIAR